MFNVFPPARACTIATALGVCPVLYFLRSSQQSFWRFPICDLTFCVSLGESRNLSLRHLRFNYFYIFLIMLERAQFHSFLFGYPSHGPAYWRTVNWLHPWVLLINQPLMTTSPAPLRLGLMRSTQFFKNFSILAITIYYTLKFGCWLNDELSHKYNYTKSCVV